MKIISIEGTYCLLIEGNSIINSDYEELQSGTVNVCDNIEVVTFESKETMGKYIVESGMKTPLPFELSDDEIEELNKKTETQWTAQD